MSEIRQRCLNNGKTITNTISSSAKLTFSSSWSKQKTSRKQVQRQRRKENNALASPPTRAEIVFTEQYMNREFNGHQERFLLADSGGDYRILIFGSEATGGWANQMEHVFMDGTFSGNYNLVMYF
uniref:PLAT domain-containing protein n=1 Tax=Meloidogyne hapla TaxID=6305 RepID=A0A1I8B9P9_MELHA